MMCVLRYKWAAFDPFVHVVCTCDFFGCVHVLCGVHRYIPVYELMHA